MGPGHRGSFRDFAVFNTWLPRSASVLLSSQQMGKTVEDCMKGSAWKILLGQAWMWCASLLPAFSWPALCHMVPLKWRGLRKCNSWWAAASQQHSSSILWKGTLIFGRQLDFWYPHLNSFIFYVIKYRIMSVDYYHCHQFAHKSSESAENDYKACSNCLLSRKDKYLLFRLPDKTYSGIVYRAILHNGLFHPINVYSTLQWSRTYLFIWVPLRLSTS